MSTLFFFAALVCMLAVLVTLLWGIVTMTKGAQEDRVKSNKLMRMRVFLQGLAVLFMLLSYAAK